MQKSEIYELKYELSSGVGFGEHRTTMFVIT